MHFKSHLFRNIYNNLWLFIGIVLLVFFGFCLASFFHNARVINSATKEFTSTSISYLPNADYTSQLQAKSLAAKINPCFENGRFPQNIKGGFNLIWLNSNTIIHRLVEKKIKNCILSFVQPLMLSDPKSAFQITGLAQQMGYPLPNGYEKVAHWVPGERIDSL